MATPVEQPQQPPEQEQDAPVIEALVVILLAGYTISVTKSAIQKLLAGLKLDKMAIAEATNFALNIPMDYQPPKTNTGTAANSTRARLMRYRAGYLLNASRRLNAAVKDVPLKDKRRALSKAMTKEGRYFKMHQAMQRKRIAAAKQVDQKAKTMGDLLGWFSIPDSKTTEECQRAHGHNFYASKMPSIGYPGGVHQNCRCMIVPAWPHGKILK